MAARTFCPLGDVIVLLGFRLYVEISVQNNMATRTIRPLGDVFVFLGCRLYVEISVKTIWPLGLCVLSVT